jgi:hypothetical protein
VERADEAPAFLEALVHGPQRELLVAGQNERISKRGAGATQNVSVTNHAYG